MYTTDRRASGTSRPRGRSVPGIAVQPRRGRDGREQDAEACCPGQASSTGRPTARAQRGARSRGRRRAAVRAAGGGSCAGFLYPMGGGSWACRLASQPEAMHARGTRGRGEKRPPRWCKCVARRPPHPPAGGEKQTVERRSAATPSATPRAAAPASTPSVASGEGRAGARHRTAAGWAVYHNRTTGMPTRPPHVQRGEPRPPPPPPAGANRRHGQRGGKERPSAVCVWLRARRSVGSSLPGGNLD